MDAAQRAWLRGVSAGATVVSFDGGAVPVAVGQIGTVFHLDVARALWIPATTLLAIAVLLPALGQMADRYDRLYLYCVGLAVLAATSLACALAPSYWVLLIARTAQGAGSALIVATSAALATQALPGSLRGRALGVNTTYVYLGTTIGPPLSGLMIAGLGWRALFLGTSLGALGCLAYGAWLTRRRLQRLDDTRSASPETRTGPTGSRPVLRLILVGLGQTAVLVVLTGGPVWGWASAPSLFLLVTGVMFLACAAIVRATRGRGPVDCGVWRGNRLLQHAVVSALLTYVAVHATAVLTALLLTLVQRRPAWQSGLVLLVQPLTMVALAGPAGRLYDRLGSRVLTTFGQLTIGAGLLTLSSVSRDPGWAGIAGGLAITGAGLALFSTPNISAVLGSVPPTLLSRGTAILATLRFSGQTASVALLGAIVASGVDRPLQVLQGDPSAAESSALAVSYAHALLTGCAVAAVGALVSATRGPERPSRAGGHSAAER